MQLKMLSWNVNGLRAISRKPGWDWLMENEAGIICLQETKASPDQLDAELRQPPGWHSYWDSSSVRKGYSGVCVLAREEPLDWCAQLPDPRWQGEGRLLHLEYPGFHLLNGYFPNGGAEVLDENGRVTGFRRLTYKLGFFDAFLDFAGSLCRSKPVVVCGDFNIAHKPEDLARPAENAGVTGFLPEERAVLDKFTGMGFVDTFRLAHGPESGNYTWWSYRTRARERNVGWRLDYFFVSRDLAGAVRQAWIEKDVTGSDHCPVGLELEI